MTLQFMGILDEGQLDAVQQAAAKIQSPEFSLTLYQVGSFPSPTRTSVFWVGVGASDELIALHQTLFNSLSSLDLGLEDRKFAPHITVGRTKRRLKIDARSWLAEHLLFESDPFNISAFHLFSSELRPSGAVYRVVASYPLVEQRIV